MNCPHCQKAIPANELQRELGRKKSDAKTAAARANGKKGGRPKRSVNHRLEVKSMAWDYGAEIEVTKTDDGWQIDVTAPDGKCWNGPATLIAHHGGTWGKADDAWRDLYERMQEGLTDRDDE